MGKGESGEEGDEVIHPSDEGATFEPQTSEEAVKQAKANGWDVAFPTDDELQLDIDDTAAARLFDLRKSMVHRHWIIDSTTRRESKSGNSQRFHLTVKLSRKVTPLERIALQMFLGSDPKRELFSLIRTTQNDPNPTLFFEKKKVSV
jgi:hypothetical protein